MNNKIPNLWIVVEHQFTLPLSHHSMLRHVCNFGSHKQRSTLIWGNGGLIFGMNDQLRSKTYFDHCLSWWELKVGQVELNTQKFKFSQKSVLFIERYFDMCTFHKLNQKSENCFANLTKNAFKMCIPYIFLCFPLRFLRISFFQQISSFEKM